MGMVAGGKRLGLLVSLAALIGWVPASGAWAQTPVETKAVVPVDATVGSQNGTEASEAAVRQTRWQLRRGVPVHTQLQGWASNSDWTLTWQPRVSWLVAADVTFDGTFEEALKAVIEGLFFEGKPVRLVLWQGNRLAEVVSSDAR